MKSLNYSRAAVTVFLAALSMGCASAPKVDTSTPFPVAVSAEEVPPLEESIEEIKKIGIYCTIVNRGLGEVEPYSKFYQMVAWEYRNVRCGDYGKVK